MGSAFLQTPHLAYQWDGAAKLHDCECFSASLQDTLVTIPTYSYTALSQASGPSRRIPKVLSDTRAKLSYVNGSPLRVLRTVLYEYPAIPR